MKRDNINYIVFVLFYVTVIVMSISHNTYSFLSGFVAYLFPIITIILVILNSKSEIKKNIRIVLIVLSFLIMLASVFITSGGIGSFLSIINFVCLLYLTKFVKISKKRRNTFLFLTLLFYVVNAINSYGIWGKYIMGENIINPNTIAMNVVYATIMLIVLLMKSQIRYRKLIGVMLCAISLVLTTNCHCRNASVVLVVYTAIIIIPRLKGLFSKRISLILWIIALIGVLIPILYSNKVFGEMSFLEQISEKTIYSGREVIWKNMLSALSDNKSGFLVGLGSHNETDIGVINNYHTWYLGILYMYGIPIFFSYYYILINKIRNIKDASLKDGFIAIFIMGIFETAAIWLYVQCLVFILLLFDNIEIEDYSVKPDVAIGGKK